MTEPISRSMAVKASIFCWGLSDWVAGVSVVITISHASRPCGPLISSYGPAENYTAASRWSTAQIYLLDFKPMVTKCLRAQSWSGQGRSYRSKVQRPTDYKNTASGECQEYQVGNVPGRGWILPVACQG